MTEAMVWARKRAVIASARSVCSCAGFGNDWIDTSDDTKSVDVPIWLMQELWDRLQKLDKAN